MMFHHLKKGQYFTFNNDRSHHTCVKTGQRTFIIIGWRKIKTPEGYRIPSHQNVRTVTLSVSVITNPANSIKPIKATSEV